MKQKDSSRMNKKLIVFALISVLIAWAFYGIALVQSPENLIISGSGFSILLSETETIITGSSSEYFVNFTVSSGLLNGTDARISIYEKSGSISFIPQNDTTLLFSVVNSTGKPLDFQTNLSYQKLGNFTYSVSVLDSSTRAVISWRFGQATFTNWEFYFGMAGVIIMVCAPCWFAIKLRDGLRNADEIVERLVYAGILFVIGYAMLIIWLGAYV